MAATMRTCYIRSNIAVLLCILMTSASSVSVPSSMQDGFVEKDRASKYDEATRTIAGTLLVMGGFNLSGGQDGVMQYDVWAGDVFPIADGPDMPYRSWYSGAAQKKNAIYVAGGRSTNLPGHFPGAFGTAVMSLQHGLWQTLPSLTYPRSKPCVFVLEDTLFVAGGGESTYIESLDLIDVKAGWAVSGSLPFPMNYPVSAVIGDAVYITYGWYLLTWSVSLPYWSALMDHETRFGHCMVSDGQSRLWVFGGEDTLSVMMYDVPGYRWTKKSPVPHDQPSLTGHQCVYHDGHVYVVTGGYSNTIYSYNVQTDTWKSFVDIMSPITQMSAGILSWG